MKTIRNNVFETNSSSCHSITFSTGYPDDQKDYQLLVTGDGDFGWGYDKLETPAEKMNYATIAYACICASEDECEQVLSEIKRVFALHGVTVSFSENDAGEQQAIWFEVDDWDKSGIATAHTSGYIDHQSQPHESDNCERLAKMFRDDPDELYSFVFGDAYIIIDNDNG
jgi:hypothetical protein